MKYSTNGEKISAQFLHIFPLNQPKAISIAEKFIKTHPDFDEIKSLAEKLAWYRYNLGLTQKDVAAHIGVDRVTYYRYEHNQFKKIPTDKLKDIAELFNVSLDELNY